MYKFAKSTKLWFIRFCIFAVTLWNLQAAFVLLSDPSGQSINFMVKGEIGSITVISIGILFVMWNIPYIIAVIHPIKWNILLVVILLMQLTGLFGEIWIMPLAKDLAPMRMMIQRFLLFDSVGFVLLSIAFITSKSIKD